MEHNEEGIEFKDSDYPITHGIHRISSLEDWPKNVKADLITEFVEMVFQKTGEPKIISKKNYYNDVYSLRDILIRDAFKKNKLSVKGNTLKNTDIKKERVFKILAKTRFLGTNIKSYSSHRTYKAFWECDIPFQLLLSNSDIKKEKKKIKSPHSKADKHLEIIEQNNHVSPSDYNNDLQKQTIKNTRSKWIRSNVRTQADANHLSWDSILDYLEFLLASKRKSVFIIAVLSFCLGFSKKRWKNATIDMNKKLTDQNLFLDPKNQIIAYKVARGATKFTQAQQRSNSDSVHIALPKISNLSKILIEGGIKDERASRTFSEKSGGPTPGLNRIARAGHNLLRRHAGGETNAFILAGNIPIEFSSRCAYKSLENQVLNDLFNKNLDSTLNRAKKSEKRHPLTVNYLKKLIQAKKENVGNHKVGSELSQVQCDFSRVMINQCYPVYIKDAIYTINQLELYYFWMVQYAAATRAIGPSTESQIINQLRLHRDKDSEAYKEVKVLLEPELIKDQFRENLACREKFLRLLKKHACELKGCALTDNMPLFFELNNKKTLVASHRLLANQAQSMTEAEWSIRQPFDRLNAHRHQCSTFMHDTLGEQYADIWLGHHIDGYFFAAPESSANFDLLEKVSDVQTAWLENLGFHLIRNPLR